MAELSGIPDDGARFGVQDEFAELVRSRESRCSAAASSTDAWRTRLVESIVLRTKTRFQALATLSKGARNANWT